jgi:hypothetical protein
MESWSCWTTRVCRSFTGCALGSPDAAAHRIAPARKRRRYSRSISWCCAGKICVQCLCWSVRQHSSACSRRVATSAICSVNEHGEAIYRHFEQLGLEGVVGKRADAPYKAGRTEVWKKVKTPAFKTIEAKRLEHIRK